MVQLCWIPTNKLVWHKHAIANKYPEKKTAYACIHACWCTSIPNPARTRLNASAHLDAHTHTENKGMSSWFIQRFVRHFCYRPYWLFLGPCKPWQKQTRTYRNPTQTPWIPAKNPSNPTQASKFPSKTLWFSQSILHKHLCFGPLPSLYYGPQLTSVFARNSPEYLQETHLSAVNHATSPSCWFMLARQIEQKTAAAHCPSSQKVTHPNQTNKGPSRTPEKHQQNTTKPPANSYRKHKATLSTSYTTLTKSHKTLTKADHQPTLIKSSKNQTKTQQNLTKSHQNLKKKQKLGKPASKIIPWKIPT